MLTVKELTPLIGKKIQWDDAQPDELREVSRDDGGFLTLTFEHYVTGGGVLPNVKRRVHATMAFLARYSTRTIDSCEYKIHVHVHRPPTSAEFRRYGPHVPCHRRGYCNCPRP